MPYSSKDYKETNVNYINKDFNNIKNSLMNYAKSYFPNSYKDFNETSPGMMLLEMSAYVGDVLNFYMDQQYKEMLLPLAEERRNVTNIAKMLGYKPKAITTSFVELTFDQLVDSVDGEESKVDYTTAGVFEKGIQVTSATDTDLVFETLEDVDFTITSSTQQGESDTSEPYSYNSETGLVSQYRIVRKVKAISAETKTKTFSVGAPTKFLKLILSETNVIDIISVVDSNNNQWYEVNYLAQDKVPIETPYFENESRETNNTMDDAGNLMSSEVPYSLEYITTNKRFTVETNEDRTTTLTFGNGLLRNGVSVDESFLDLEQLGVIVPGQTSDLNDEIDPLLGDDYDTLGEAPSHLTLTVTYRIGGGINSNVSAGDLSSFTSTSPVAGAGTINSVTNETPAAGGKNQDTIIEIKEKTKAFFSTQNRCVTKEDYKARILNMPAKFGNIAKVYVSRALDSTPTTYIGENITTAMEGLQTIGNDITALVVNIQNIPSEFEAMPIAEIEAMIANITSMALDLQGNFGPSLITPISSLATATETTPYGSISIYLLGYDSTKSLLGNPDPTLSEENNDGLPNVLKENVRTYLNNFKLLTDVVDIYDGFIINFGVYFEVLANKFINKQEVKLNCIKTINNYFSVEKMQFGQAIHISKLEYELMKVDGVKSIKKIELTQDIKGNKLYRYSYDTNTNSYIEDSEGSTEYGYKYDFTHSWDNGINPGVVLPPHPNNPAVFELKNPNQNIIGVVI